MVKKHATAKYRGAAVWHMRVEENDACCCSAKIDPLKVPYFMQLNSIRTYCFDWRTNRTWQAFRHRCPALLRIFLRTSARPDDRQCCDAVWRPRPLRGTGSGATAQPNSSAHEFNQLRTGNASVSVCMLGRELFFSIFFDEICTEE